MHECRASRANYPCLIVRRLEYDGSRRAWEVSNFFSPDCTISIAISLATWGIPDCHAYAEHRDQKRHHNQCVGEELLNHRHLALVPPVCLGNCAGMAATRRMGRAQRRSCRASREQATLAAPPFRSLLSSRPMTGGLARLHPDEAQRHLCEKRQHSGTLRRLAPDVRARAAKCGTTACSIDLHGRTRPRNHLRPGRPKQLQLAPQPDRPKLDRCGRRHPPAHRR